MDDESIIRILYNLLIAVKFIHSANIIHRDLKPSNILIDSNLKIQICDFGRSRSIPGKVKQEPIYKKRHAWFDLFK